MSKDPRPLRFGLKDCASGAIYPMHGCPSWTAAYCAAEDATSGLDVGLPVPPRPGSHLCPVILPMRPPGAALSAARAARYRERDACEREQYEREVAALFPARAGQPPSSGIASYTSLGQRLLRAFWRFWSGSTALIVTMIIAAALLLGRRLLP